MDQLKMIHLVAIAPRPPHRYMYGDVPVHLGDI